MLPTLSQLFQPVGKPGKEPVEEGRYGFGTTVAFDAFLKNITNLKGSHEILLAVNIATLLRNNISSSVYVDGKKIESTEKRKLNPEGVVAKTRSHMVEMANEFANICDAKFKDRKHHILFYLTDPTKQIPKDWQRPRNSESSMNLDIVTRVFCKTVKPIDQTSDNTELHIRLADQMRVPSFKGLAEVFKLWTMSSVDVHLISHEPIDYHVAQYSGRKGFLYRSHTGAVIPLTPSDLGKTVFKENQIPFYPVTHVMLGDKSLIKGCLAKKDRDRLIAQANTERWGLRTSEYIAVKVNEYGVHLPYTLNNFPTN